MRHTHEQFTKEPDNHVLRFEYSEITPYIYIGTNLCCQTHFEEELLSKGITADISLEEERLDAPYGVDAFLWLPTKDKLPPTQEQLALGVAMIDLLVNQKQKVYVHCFHGHGRSPTLVAAYFISQGDTVEQALSKIKEKRESMHLQESQIEALEHFLRSRR